MNIRRRIIRPGLPVAALLAVTLSACGLWQQPTAKTNVAAAAPSAQATAASAANPATTRVATRNPIVKRKGAEHARSTASTADVLARLHRTDLNEIAMAQVAEHKAASPEVRSYADQLIKDRTAVDKTVVAMAQNSGVHLREPSASAGAKTPSTKEMGKLNAASAAHFDKLFLHEARADNERLIATLKHDRANSRNDDVEVLVDQVMPVLIQDRKQAQALMSKRHASKA